MRAQMYDRLPDVLSTDDWVAITTMPASGETRRILMYFRDVCNREVQVREIGRLLGEPEENPGGAPFATINQRFRGVGLNYRLYSARPNRTGHYANGWYKIYKVVLRE